MDITTTAVEYLNAVGVGAEAYPVVPRTRPAAFLVVEQVGGYFHGETLYHASIDVDAWAPTRPEADALAQAAAEALKVMPASLENAFHVEVSAYYHNPDPDTETPRYTITADAVFCI